MASKGGVLGNEFSGWLVFTVKDVKEGVIVLALETSHDPNESTRTEGWTEARTSEKQEEKKEEKEEQAKEEEKKAADNDDAKEEDATEKKDDSDNKAEKDDNKEKSENGDEDGGKLRRLRRRRQLKSADQASSQSDRILLPDQFKYVQLISILLFHRYRCHQSSFTSSLTYISLPCHLYFARVAVATDLNTPSVAKSQHWTRNPSRTD
jgi:flagellar biosynthesis GTPase FlhF